MTVQDFIAKWEKVSLTERSAAQQHFLDLCELFRHQKPADVDPTGDFFTFEKGAAKHGGGDGWADVWKRHAFAVEYKGKHKDLDAAYDQLLKYREALENPPLLVVCDMDRIVVHTNFTNTATQVYDIPLAELGKPRNREIMERAFHAPDKLRPGATSEAITAEVASHLAEIALSMRHPSRKNDPSQVAHFLDRIVFCLFAQSTGLLPENLFSRIVEKAQKDTKKFSKLISLLFEAMAQGGDFGEHDIRHFNGNLFTDNTVLELTREEIAKVLEATALDWSAVDPSIFGTLFVRGMDPDQRAQLGAQYTSREDIETLIEPVLMAPLRGEWERLQEEVNGLLAKAKGKAGRRKPEKLVQDYLERVQHVRVLDPACGSGNFLYVALQKLIDLEKDVLLFAHKHEMAWLLPNVGPWQLYGIEINAYAYDLAQMTVWIGWLQAMRVSPFGMVHDPVLRPLDNFLLMDAILDRTDPDSPQEPEWPEVDCIVGNPPFLGGKKMRSELGGAYVDTLFRVWKERVRPEADLCCYFFEKARNHIEKGKCKRAGLLATQGIRGGANRATLERIKKTGDIFFAESDRDWVLDGANVHISMVGFDAGTQSQRLLNGQAVSSINANLSAEADIARARRLAANLGISFMGDTKGGPFDIPADLAEKLLQAPNAHGVPNSDVVVPWANGKDVTGRPRGMWLIDFGAGMSEEDAARYEEPFDHVQTVVKPLRLNNSRESYRRLWWQHVEARPALRSALAPLPRFLATPRVAKHRLFVWMQAPTLPDCQLIVFARADDFFFGILQSRLHEVWGLHLGTRLETRPRYTPTTCFETFPFPPATEAQKNAIAEAAKKLDELRNNWLNPKDYTRERILSFPASADGRWSRYVSVASAEYPQLVSKGHAQGEELAKRTLTKLYNSRPPWLQNAHRKPDEAVFAAYGWDPGMSDQDILAALLELNLKAGAVSGPKGESEDAEEDEDDEE